MSRTRTLAAAVAIAVLAVPAAASAHQGDPNYRSTVTAAPAGLRAEVLNYDDSLEVTNTSRETVVVEGYDREPYVRLRPDGTVEVNRNSPAFHLNDERDGGGTVPPTASRRATPDWRTVDRTGRYAYHDHRIHYMGKGRPPSITDPSKPAKAYDWSVPLRVGSRTAVVRGELRWVPTPEDGPSVAAFGGLGALALAGIALAVVVRRRRSAPGAGEAW